jgi:hypothetical protein
VNTTGIPARDAVDKVLIDVAGLPAFLAGSSAAAVAHDLQHSYTDIDLFVPKEGVYFALVQHLLSNGYEIEGDRFERMWQRHLNYGFNAWHTNSMKLIDSTFGTEVNVIYKRVERHETTQLSQVIESFDFGLLGVGYETATKTYRDMRSYLFPHIKGADSGAPLPMMGYRGDTVGKGFMSSHIMMRTPGRYARYVGYGYDLSLVKPILVDGYNSYADYKDNRTKDEDRALATISRTLAGHIEYDMLEEILTWEKSIPMADGLDDILEALE